MKKSLGAVLVFGAVFFGATHTASAFTVADLLQKVQVLKSEIQTLRSNLSAAAITGTTSTISRTASTQSVEKLNTQIDAIETTIKTATTTEVAPVVVSPITADTIIFSQDLKSGAKSDDVVKLQDFLKSQGYFQGTSTGLFGPKTVESLKLWQNLNGINPTGVFDAKTRAVINSLRVKAPTTATTGERPVPGTTGVNDCVVNSFTATPNPVTVGQTVTFSWSTTNCTAGAITSVTAGYNYSIPTGSIATGSVTKTFSTAGSYAFGIRATGNGTLGGKSITVVVNPVDPWTTLCADGQPHIQVLSPNGGETYTAGQQVIVKWKSCGLLSSDRVYIETIGWNPDWFSSQRALDLPNTGSATLLMPSSTTVNNQTYISLGGYNVPTGNNFSIEIGRFGPGQNFMDRSDNHFTINAAQNCELQTTPSATNPPTSNVSVGTNGFTFFNATLKAIGCDVTIVKFKLLWETQTSNPDINSTMRNIKVVDRSNGAVLATWSSAPNSTSNDISVNLLIPKNTSKDIGIVADVIGGSGLTLGLGFNTTYNTPTTSNIQTSAIRGNMMNIVSSTSTYACNDGIDNDGDGYVDMGDPGCFSPTDNDEYNTNASSTYIETLPYGGLCQETHSFPREGICNLLMSIKNTSNTPLWIGNKTDWDPNTTLVIQQFGGSTTTTFSTAGSGWVFNTDAGCGTATNCSTNGDSYLAPGEKRMFSISTQFTVTTSTPTPAQVRLKLSGIPIKLNSFLSGKIIQPLNSVWYTTPISL